MTSYSFIAWLLDASFMGAILAGLLLLTRLILGNLISARWRHLLWFLLVFKLAVPWAPESSFSLFNIFGHSLLSQEISLNVDENRARDHREGSESQFTSSIYSGEDYSLSVDKDAARSKRAVLFWLWLMGAIGVATHATFLNFRLWRSLKETRPVRDRHILDLFEACKCAIRIPGDGSVLHESPTIRVPMVTGILRPHILLPIGTTENLSMGELKFILLHELAHLKRRDLHFNRMMLFLQIMHWFNPMVWYAFRHMRQDQELACDARVLSTLRPAEYPEYGAALISFLERYSCSCSLTAAKLVSGKTRMKKRISVIASYRKENAAGTFWGILLIALLGCLALTDPKTTTSTFEDVPRQIIESEDLSHYFEHFDGSFIMLDLETERYGVYNERNSRTRVSPDSTYKILSSLAGLESGALASEDSELKWDGTVYPFQPWNKDQTLISAMANSVSWFFQKIDSTTGKERIEEYLKQTGYGNHDTSGDLNGFWFESSLLVSPMEQVEMLKNLYNYQMPFSHMNIDSVKKAIKISEIDGVVLSGKTGTGIVDGKSINGWFIGYVENNGKVHIFATNIRGKDDANGTKAKEIALSILKDKKLI